MNFAVAIPSDRLIGRDSERHHLPEWPFDDGHIHAIEYKDGISNVQLIGPPFTNELVEGTAPIDPYLEYLDAWLAATASPQP